MSAPRPGAGAALRCVGGTADGRRGTGDDPAGCGSVRTGGGRGDGTVGELAASLIGSVVERVFGTVTRAADVAAAAHRAAGERGERLCERDVTALREPLLALLRREREIAVGLGLIVAPGLLADRALRMEWWQAEPERPAPVLLEVDLNPHSVGFYDYAAAEWFVVPRRTGRRHVVGPYVDVHGTDRYLLTLTVPVVAGGEFVGVAGADVPVAWFETLVLRELGELAVDVVVVNPEDRVVLSTTAQWLTGSRAAFADDIPSVALADPRWRVLVTRG